MRVLHLHQVNERILLSARDGLVLRAAHARHPCQVQIIVELRDDRIAIAFGLARLLDIAIRRIGVSNGNVAAIERRRHARQLIGVRTAERGRLHQIALGIELRQQAVFAATAFALKVELRRLRCADGQKAAIVRFRHAVEQVGLLALDERAPLLASGRIIANENGIRLAFSMLIR